MGRSAAAESMCPLVVGPIGDREAGAALNFLRYYYEGT